MENNLKLDFIEKYSEVEYEEVSELIDKMFDDDSDSFDQDKYLWKLSLSKEKHNVLQYTYYINLSKEIDGQDDEEVNITYENGINNGTAMIDYDIDGGGGVPAFKTVEILDDIIPDWTRILNGKDISDMRKKNMQMIFDAHKSRILKSLHNQNYDNYVTGGGTNMTDAYYCDIKEKLNSHGFYWICVYKEIEADVILV